MGKNMLDTALKFVFKWEGGYSDDKNDPGGETNYGISKRAHPYLDIKNLDLHTATHIYKDKYWDQLDCDRYEPKLAVCIMDAAVNVGVGRVTKWLGEDFGKSGLNYEEFNSRREYFYRVEVRQSLSNQYLKGWLNRLNDLRKYVETI